MNTTLRVYPAGSGKAPFIGQLVIDQTQLNKPVEKPKEKKGFKASIVSYFSSNKKKKTVNNVGVETIIIVDVSGSMGQNVERIIRNYLPAALTKVGFKPDDQVTIITFSSDSHVYKLRVSELPTNTLKAYGGTYMATGIRNLRTQLSTSEMQKFRILTISDGALHDTATAMSVSSELSAFVKERQFIVSSTAIRLYTSQWGEPDTRGLSSILQLNTIERESSITDINQATHGYSNEIISDMFAELLKDDLGNSILMTMSRPLMMMAPWSTALSETHLVNGVNTFWLSEDPSASEVTVTFDMDDGKKHVQKLTVEMQEPLGFKDYNSILKEKVSFFMKKLRVLKVLGTEQSKEEIDAIVAYFSDLDRFFSLSDPETVDLMKNPGIKSRLQFFKEMAKKKNRSVSLQMAEIANDSKVNQMNSAQQAAYLRTVQMSKNAKNLAKRAIGQGLDFDIIARREIKQMAEHIRELDDIDDTHHYKSFYSRETTLGGMRAVCELVDEENTIDDVSAIEILQLINIVGIPAIAQVGDFPDPKTYHFSKLLLGSFVSMSDILIVKDQGQVLNNPYGDKEEIINTVPFYDDDRIQRFLMKYAPTLLEYTASLGMRQLVVNVPHTYKYTVVGGLYNMSRRITKEKTEINVDVFTKLVRTYKDAVGGLFKYVLPLIKEQSAEDKANNLSLYIGNNGVTNMIGPLIDIMEEAVKGNPEKSNFAPDILRALFSFEFYQVIRKFHRSDDDGYLKREKMLNDMLGIDYAKYGTVLPSHFELNEKPVFHREAHLNEGIYKEICKRVYWIDNIAMLPHYIYNSFRGEEGKKEILETPELTDKVIAETLGIDFDKQTFKLYCIAQSFLFGTKASRVDDDNLKMKIEDCGNYARMDKMIGDYISGKYRADYQSRLNDQKKEEQRILADELVGEMVRSKTIEEFIRLFKEGKTRSHVHQIVDTCHRLGFIGLRDQLFSPDVEVPLRKEKLRILILGCDTEDNVVWNRGNVMRMPLPKLVESFTRVGLEELWNDIYPIYKKKNVHIYREPNAPNRHTHSNDNPSYYAFGYKNLGAYFADITKEEQEEYKKSHPHCCGIWDGKVYRWA